MSTIKIGRKSVWISSGNFSNNDDFSEIITKYSSNKRVIIRGCNSEISTTLKINGFQRTLFAQEAIINLKKPITLSKKHQRRIKSLLNRGSVKEVYYNKKNEKQFSEFLKSTVHWKKPKLKNLFLDKIDKNTRLFVFEFDENKWEGAILVSQNSPSKMQGEQFFRKKDGKNGIMDTLVYHLVNLFSEEGFNEFSLGEVPFITSDNINTTFKAKLLKQIGRKIKFAYNYENLFYFKNKFATYWDDVYICTNTSLNFWDLLGIARKSNLLSLIAYKILN
mgnify:CR=1 FL=1